MPKYDFAIYYDPNGNKHKLWPNDLHDVSKRAAARTTELWDPDEEYRLFPRYRVDSPHFFSLSEKARTLSRGKESDQAHNQRIEDILKILATRKNFSIGCYDWTDDEKQFVSFTKTRSYSWEQEVTRSLTADVRCRHDIFGASNGLNLTAGLPWIAIEIVKHHYPDEQTFSAFLSLTNELPCVILFDFIDVPNYFLSIDEKSAEIRVIYYIYDGSVWKNRRRWQSCNAALFKEKVAAHVNEKKLGQTNA